MISAKRNSCSIVVHTYISPASENIPRILSGPLLLFSTLRTQHRSRGQSIVPFEDRPALCTEGSGLMLKKVGARNPESHQDLHWHGVYFWITIAVCLDMPCSSVLDCMLRTSERTRAFLVACSTTLEVPRTAGRSIGTACN